MVSAQYVIVAAGVVSLIVTVCVVEYVPATGANVGVAACEPEPIEKLMKSTPTLFCSLLLTAVFHCQLFAPLVVV